MIFSFWKTVKCNHRMFPCLSSFKRFVADTNFPFFDSCKQSTVFSSFKGGGGGGFGGAVFRAALFTSEIVASILAADRKASVNALPKGMLTGWVGVAR